MVDVYFRHSHYDDPGLKQVVFDMMRAMGGDNIPAGAKVLIKPNFLLAAGADLQGRQSGHDNHRRYPGS